jgi:hypothetical protein
MKTNVARWILVGAFAFASLPALAADSVPGHQPTVQEQEARLESGYTTLASRRNTTKLGAAKQGEIMRQQHAIKDMIRRLEAGEAVAPSEVDQVLRAR